MFNFSSILTSIWGMISGPAIEAFQKFTHAFAQDALDAVEAEWPKVASGQEKWDAALAVLKQKVVDAGWKDAEDFCETLLQSAYQAYALKQGKVATPPTPL